MRHLILVLALLFSIPGIAQHFEAGMMVGGSNYLGDLSSNSTKLHLNETHFSGGLFAKYNFNYLLALRLNFNYGAISGADENASDELIRQRNLSFRSNLFEFGLIGEFNIPGYQPYNLWRPFSPYIFAGVTYYSYKPTTEYEFQTIELQPLGTEGQGMSNRPAPYNLNGFSIPFGIGFKYAINDKLNVGLEIGARKTFTDYLDDVSTTYVSSEELRAANGELAATLANRTGEYLGTDPISVPTGTARGDDTPNDWYFIAGLTISYNFMDNGLVGSRNRNRRKTGCPTSRF